MDWRAQIDVHWSRNTGFLDEKSHKSVKFHQKFVKKSSKNTFFVKTTYSQCAGNQSVFFFGSGRIFLIFRDPLTASKGKIGGFRFKSLYREQMLLLLLMITLVYSKRVSLRNYLLTRKE